MIRKIKEIYNGRETLDSRIFAIVVLVGTIVTGVSTVFTFFENLGIAAAIATFVCFLLFVVILYLAYVKGYEKESHILLCIVANFILLPVTFFMCGGVRSGMCFYILNTLYIIVPVIADKRKRILLFLLSLAMLTMTIYVSVYVKPEWVVQVTDDAWYIDAIISLIINAFCIYFISHLTVLAYENERQQKEELLQRLADLSIKDDLTGLYNRRELFRILTEGTGGSDDNRYLVMFDIDDFKKVNDHYGHLFGDEVLKRISQRLGEALHMEDGEFAARYGGEEFIYILRAESFDRAYERADGIREAFFGIQYEEHPEIHISVSEGIAAFAAFSDINQLLKRADELLYQAKRNGKNRVERD